MRLLDAKSYRLAVITQSQHERSTGQERGTVPTLKPQVIEVCGFYCPTRWIRGTRGLISSGKISVFKKKNAVNRFRIGKAEQVGVAAGGVILGGPRVSGGRGGV